MDGLVTLPSRFDVPARRHAAMLAAAQAPVEPGDAASVILVRDSPGAAGGLEVFLLHRVAEMAFAGGMTVFPGGGVAPGDRRELALTGSAPARWARRWDGEEADEHAASALLACAVRETFEETGVLLAGPTGSGGASAPADAAALAAVGVERAGLTDASRDLVDVLAAAGLAVRDDLLHPWARWITPAAMPKRYDTRFFVAVLPPGQDADGQTTEAVEAGWSTPDGALAAFEAGERALMPVTWAVLRDVGRHRDTASLVADAAARRPRPVVPQVLLDGERLRLAVPAHAGVELTDGDRARSEGTDGESA